MHGCHTGKREIELVFLLIAVSGCDKPHSLCLSVHGNFSVYKILVDIGSSGSFTLGLRSRSRKINTGKQRRTGTLWAGWRLILCLVLNYEWLQSGDKRNACLLQCQIRCEMAWFLGYASLSPTTTSTTVLSYEYLPLQTHLILGWSVLMTYSRIEIYVYFCKCIHKYTL